MYCKICSMTTTPLLHQRKKDLPFSICKPHYMTSVTSILHISASMFILSITEFQLGARMPSPMWHHLYFVNALQRIRSSLFLGTRHLCDRWVAVGSTCKSPVEVSCPTSCVKEITCLIEDSTRDCSGFNPEAISNYSWENEIWKFLIALRL